MIVSKARRRKNGKPVVSPPEICFGSQCFEQPGEDAAPTPEALERKRGFDESLRSAFSQHPASKPYRDQQVNHAYRESILLEALKPHLRDGWSLSREKRLADILGPWRRDDVCEIDLPSLLKVDEWVECQAQLLLRDRELSIQQRREIAANAAWVEAQLADCPAQTIFGIIAKLMVWRRRHARQLAYDKGFQRRHALAYAAYADLIRLTGLYSLTLKEDRDAGLVGEAPTPVASRRKVRKSYRR